MVTPPMTNNNGVLSIRTKDENGDDGTIVELKTCPGPEPHRFRHPWSPDHQGRDGMPDAAGVRLRP